jgi:hypothetical protein
MSYFKQQQHNSWSIYFTQLYNKRYLFENNKAYLKIEFIFECVFFSLYAQSGTGSACGGHVLVGWKWNDYTFREDQSKFEDTKGVIRRRKSKKGRQFNGQKKTVKHW